MKQLPSLFSRTYGHGFNILHFDEIYCMVVRQQALEIQNIVVNIRTILATKLEL